VKRNRIFLILLVAILALTLTGCGVPYEGVDVQEIAPDGTWQTVVVWPLAKALIYLNDWLAGLNVPYHWGFAIIAFTFVIKIITLPLTISQIRGMQAQKNLQPKLQELQKKYGKDREAMAREQMKLYKEAGVNPVSGCLPLIIQMPVLIGLYAALVAIGPMLKNASWFWIPDLGFPTNNEGMSWLTKAFGEGDYGLLIAYLILPALLMVTQIWMQKAMTPPSTDPQMQSMQQMSLVMTVMFGFFTLQVPAGLTLYWVTSNLLQMLQTWLFNRTGISNTATSISVANTSDTPASAPASSTLATEAATTGSRKEPTTSSKTGSGKSKRNK
jgi:YidC/Oxa1 family membrane protein insertase